MEIRLGGAWKAAHEEREALVARVERLEGQLRERTAQLAAERAAASAAAKQHASTAAHLEEVQDRCERREAEVERLRARGLALAASRDDADRRARLASERAAMAGEDAASLFHSRLVQHHARRELETARKVAEEEVASLTLQLDASEAAREQLASELATWQRNFATVKRAKELQDRHVVLLAKEKRRMEDRVAQLRRGGSRAEPAPAAASTLRTPPRTGYASRVRTPEAQACAGTPRTAAADKGRDAPQALQVALSRAESRDLMERLQAVEGQLAQARKREHSLLTALRNARGPRAARPFTAGGQQQ